LSFPERRSAVSDINASVDDEEPQNGFEQVFKNVEGHPRNGIHQREWQLHQLLEVALSLPPLTDRIEGPSKVLIQIKGQGQDLHRSDTLQYGEIVVDGLSQVFEISEIRLFTFES